MKAKQKSRRGVAVLTGDVVGSSAIAAAQRRALPAVLKAAARALRQAWPKALPYDVEIFRGDSWQLVVTDAVLGVRAALLYRAMVMAQSKGAPPLDTRVAVAIGDVTFLPRGNISAGDGPAYRASGEALDHLAPGVRLALVGPGASPWREVTLGLMDALAQEWTARQARAVAGKLRGWTQREIARQWPDAITQQTVARHLARAHWAAIAPALHELENSLQTL